MVKSLELFRALPDSSMLGVRHINREGDTLASCSRFLNFSRGMNDILGLSKVAPKIFNPGTLMYDWDHKDSCYVDQVMGAYMLVRREDFINCGGFNPSYFVYYEDLDLAKRLSLSGRRAYYTSEISIYHQGCGTTESVKDIRQFYMIRSRYQYTMAHWNHFKAVLFLVLTLSVDPLIRIFGELLRLNASGIKNNLSAYKKFWIWILCPNHIRRSENG